MNKERRRRHHADTVARFLAAGLISVATAGSAPIRWPSCLFGSTPVADGDYANDSSETCDDAHRVLESTQVIAIADLLGISASELEFLGCENVQFSTQSLQLRYLGSRFTIRYPKDVGSVDGMIGPIAHELGHVYQLKAAGGMTRLRESMPSISIELGADFLAGVSLRKTFTKLATSKFQHSLALIGKYWEEDYQAHGKPSQRAEAFRQGYFMNFADYDNSIANAYSDFNANRLPHILDSGKTT